MIVAREPPTLGLTQSDKPYLKQYGIALAYLHQPKTQVSTLVTQPLIPTSALGKAKLKEVRVDEALNPITTLTSWLNLPKSWSGSHFMRYCACPRRRETHSRKLSWTHQSFATLIPSTVSDKECFTCHYHVGHHLHCRGHGHQRPSHDQSLVLDYNYHPKLQHTAILLARTASSANSII